MVKSVDRYSDSVADIPTYSSTYLYPPTHKRIYRNRNQFLCLELASEGRRAAEQNKRNIYILVG